MSQNSDFAQKILDKYRQIRQEHEETRSPAQSVPKSDSNFFQKYDSKKTFNSNRGRKREFIKSSQPFKSITENEVGINQYINKDVGFKGIIKHRFSDFQVNEINKDGKLIELKSLDVPKESLVPEELKGSFSDILTEDQWKRIQEISDSSDAKEKLLIDVTDKSKEERGQIHQAIKNAFETKITTNTKESGQEKVIEVMKQTKNETRWPSGRPGYLHATMFKVNMDMTEAIHAIVDKLKLPANLIGFCGTKDKRAKTTQRISLKKRTAAALANIRLPNLTFGDFEYGSTELRLGDLSGNRFRIAIRNVTDPEEKVTEALNSLKESGFINYFGLQRFGFATTPTYVIGKSLLSSDWKQAIEHILKPRANMIKQKDLSEALKIWWDTRNATEAIKLLSKKDNSIEAKIIRALKKEGNEAYMNALFALPRNTMTMYMHAYQSLIWNKVVSRRVEKYGTSVVAGDLVVVSGSVDCLDFEDETPTAGDEEEADDEKEEDKDKEKIDVAEGADEEKEKIPEKEKNGDEGAEKHTNNGDSKKDDTEIEVVTDDLGMDVDESVKTKAKKDRSKGKRCNIEVRALTSEEAATTSIFDIVYPLPGHDIKFPDNEIAKWYEEALSEDGFKLENFNNKHKHFALSGAYRALLAKADGLEWEMVNYKHFNRDLILSDLDKIKDVELKEAGEGELRAVILEFSLKPCCYATMALREVMKCDTSVFAQASLTQEHHSAKKPRTDP